MSATETSHPTHLDPSELGTKEYWDNYYQNDLDQDRGDDDDEEEEEEDRYPADLADLESWFDDVDAPAKVLEYLTSAEFPCSPNNPYRLQARPWVLDLGTGNGSMLITLRMVGGYLGPMVGIDYSQQSIDLARKLWGHYSRQDGDGYDHDRENVRFETFDLINGDPSEGQWWSSDGFDLVLDKGTFDAISLSSETVASEDGEQRRICELYPRKVVDMIAPGGYLLITSCNWTEDEVMRWFLDNEDIRGQLELFGKIEYPSYEFGGQRGAGVASVCFHKVERR